MVVSVAMVDNDIYVPLRFICEKFNYDYKWNYEQNCIEISNKKAVKRYTRIVMITEKTGR